MLNYLQLTVVQLSLLGCNKLLAPTSNSVRVNQWMSTAISYCTLITPIAMVVQLSPLCCNNQFTPITSILGNTKLLSGHAELSPICFYALWFLLMAMINKTRYVYIGILLQEDNVLEEILLFAAISLCRINIWERISPATSKNSSSSYRYM